MAFFILLYTKYEGFGIHIVGIFYDTQINDIYILLFTKIC